MLSIKLIFIAWIQGIIKLQTTMYQTKFSAQYYCSDIQSEHSDTESEFDDSDCYDRQNLNWEPRETHADSRPAVKTRDNRLWSDFSSDFSFMYNIQKAPRYDRN